MKLVIKVLYKYLYDIFRSIKKIDRNYSFHLVSSPLSY